MMEYIQCSHCQKKYSVNDKVRASAGKKIRCKACEKPFEIVVLDVQEKTPEIKQIDAPIVEIKQVDAPVVENTQPQPVEVQPIEVQVVEVQPVEVPIEEKETTVSDDNETEEVVKEPSASTPKKKEQKPAESLEEKVSQKRRSRFYLISIVLAVLMLAVAGGLAYLYIENPDMFDSWSSQMASEQQEQTEVVTEKDVSAVIEMQRPQSPESFGPMPTPVGEAFGPKLPSEMAGPPMPEYSAVEPKKKEYRDFIEESTACTQAAAQQWMVDYLIQNMRYSTDEYLEMLDQSSKHSDTMRNSCKDKALIHEMTAAAKEGVKPFWIQEEINVLQKQQLDEIGGAAY
ncbi:MAG: zinc-ribbon domain-containing protein [Mariprofundaceae bacterium]